MIFTERRGLESEMAIFEKEEPKKKGKEKFLEKIFKVKPYKKWLAGSFKYSNSLSDLLNRKKGNEKLELSLNFNPVSYFFLRTSFYKTINGYINKYYQPDFSYSFGYDDWHPDTFSLTYSNYANDKIFNKNGYDTFNFDSGTWEFAYKTKYKDLFIKPSFTYTPKGNKRFLNLFISKNINDFLFSLYFNHYLNYTQDRLSLSIKKFIYKRFFVSGTVYLYSKLSKQTSLEPDYAYSFGWYNPKPYHLNIAYSDYYMPNRFPWRKEKGPEFLDGVISAWFNWKF